MSHTQITQTVVDEAADALLVSGERPTPERIRSFIGTGSAEAIEGLLDAWWERLGSRLLAPTAQPWFPPHDVLRIGTLMWTRAQTHANAALSAEHHVECSRLHAIIAGLEAKIAELKEQLPL